MNHQQKFEFRKAQIEQFVAKEFQSQFKGRKRISIRKRQRFMNQLTKKVSKRFGKDVMCLVDFTRNGFTTLISPPVSESTEKGKVHQSFTHPQVVYTTHCLDRFSERTQTTENCIVTLDAWLTEAMLTYGLHEGHLVSSSGVFAFEIDEDRMVIKTFINYELLSDSQIREFYGWDVVSVFSSDFIAEDLMESDIRLEEELPELPPTK